MNCLSGAVHGRGSDGAWYLQATSDPLTVRRCWRKTWHNGSETKDVIFPKSHGGYGRTRDGHLDLNGMGEGWLCYRSRVLGLGDPRPSMGSRSKLALCRGGESPHPLRPPAANPALSSGLCGEQSGPRILGGPTGPCGSAWGPWITSPNRASFFRSTHPFKCIQSLSACTEFDVKSSSEKILCLGRA